MRVAVIGDYETPGYKELLQSVSFVMAEDEVLDLSRHESTDHKERQTARWDDIENSRMVIVDSRWKEYSFDARWDINRALHLNKNFSFHHNGVIRPLNWS